MIRSMMEPFEIHSANVLGAQKPSLALRDTTDYRSKFVASPASRWLSSYACEGLRLGKEGLPYIPFANTCHCMARAYAHAPFDSKSGPIESLAQH